MLKAWCNAAMAGQITEARHCNVLAVSTCAGTYTSPLVHGTVQDYTGASKIKEQLVCLNFVALADCGQSDMV